jgi:hypothetical protein
LGKSPYDIGTSKYNVAPTNTASDFQPSSMPVTSLQSRLQKDEMALEDYQLGRAVK